MVIFTGLPASGKTTMAKELADEMGASHLCPDEWMRVARIDLWDAATRAKIEAFQLTLALDLLRAGTNVIIDWGVWAREERDALRGAARSIGAPVELRYTTAATDELWKRIVERDAEGRWGARAIERHEFDGWNDFYQRPTEDEFANYDGQPS